MCCEYIYDVSWLFLIVIVFIHVVVVFIHVVVVFILFVVVYIHVVGVYILYDGYFYYDFPHGYFPVVIYQKYGAKEG